MAQSWETFLSQADDELKEMLKEVVSNISTVEKDILKKRGVKTLKRYLEF